MRFACVSDVHAPRHLDDFEHALDSVSLGKVDGFLFAGDMVHNNEYGQVANLLKLLRRRFSGPVYACFGNNEFEGFESFYLGHQDLNWLWDQSTLFSADGEDVYIIGSKGVRDVVTPWLVWNTTPNPDPEATRRVYEERIVLLDKLLSASKGRKTVVLTHFSPCYETIEGEDTWSPGELASRRMQRLIEIHQPDVWVHGHSHKSVRHNALIGATRVYNVALPATHKLTIIEV
ncbi:MAG: metallophosphoesterase [Thermoprotei archaeon]